MSGLAENYVQGVDSVSWDTLLFVIFGWIMSPLVGT